MAAAVTAGREERKTKGEPCVPGGAQGSFMNMRHKTVSRPFILFVGRRHVGAAERVAPLRLAVGVVALLSALTLLAVLSLLSALSLLAVLSLLAALSLLPVLVLLPLRLFLSLLSLHLLTLHLPVSFCLESVGRRFHSRTIVGCWRHDSRHAACRHYCQHCNHCDEHLFHDSVCLIVDNVDYERLMPLCLLNAPRCPVIVVMELNCLNDNPKGGTARQAKPPPHEFRPRTFADFCG